MTVDLDFTQAGENIVQGIVCSLVLLDKTIMLCLHNLAACVSLGQTGLDCFSQVRLIWLVIQ